MMSNITAIGRVLQVLLEKGFLDRQDYPKIYEDVIRDSTILESLDELCRSIGLFLSIRPGVLYVAPIPGIRTFSLNNEEMRNLMHNSFKNEDLFTALFIISVMLVEFFPEASSEASLKFLKVNDLISIVDKKIEVLREETNLEQISYEKSYNFEVVVKKWSELPTVRIKKGSSDEIMEKGKSSKVQLTNTTLQFLIDQGLIQVLDHTNGEKAIYITDRFSATVSNVFNSEEIQKEIYEYIESLGGGE